MKKLTAILLCLALVCALAIPALADMQKGSNGDDVVKLQQRLIDLGYLTGTADGDFGGKTETALKAFQAANGLEETGIATDADTEALYADTAIDSQGNSAAPAEAEAPAEAAEPAEAEATEAEGEPAEAEGEPIPEAEPAPATPSREVARGKLTIWGETFVPCVSEYEGGNDEVYAFARVENTSSKPLSIYNTLFEIYDADDELIKSEDYISYAPSVLQPGESAYLYKNMYLEEGTSANDVADYEMDLNGNPDVYYTITRFPCEVEYVTNDERSGDQGMIYVTVTNDTDETVFDMRVVCALLNDIGEVLYVSNNSTSIGLLPGATVVFPMYSDYNISNYFKANNITPASADAIVFTETYR